MITAVDEGSMDFERLRRLASWAAGAAFAASFVGLLVLSATSSWTPANPWVLFFDRVWKVSGLAFLGIACLPYVAAAVRRLRALF